jgi:hypothetical protein
MTTIKLKQYRVRRDRGFWEPTPKMQALGFTSIPCGPDGPGAWAIAEEWERRWQATRSGETPSPAMVSSENLSPEQSEGLTIYPPRSLGEAFRRYRRTHEWGAKLRAPERIGGEPGSASSRYSETLIRAQSRSKMSAHGGRRLRTSFRYARRIERSKSGEPCGRFLQRSAIVCGRLTPHLEFATLPPKGGPRRGLKVRLCVSISARGATVITGSQH